MARSFRLPLLKGFNVNASPTPDEPKPAPPATAGTDRSRPKRKRRAADIDRAKRIREQYARKLLRVLSDAQEAHRSLTPFNGMDEPSGSEVEARTKVARRLESLLFELRTEVNRRSLEPTLHATFKRLWRKPRSDRPPDRPRVLRRVTVRPGPLNCLDGCTQSIVDHAVSVVHRAFGLFGTSMTPGTVELFAAAAPMDARSSTWKLMWGSLDLTLGTIDLSRLDAWLERLETFQPSAEQLDMLRLLDRKVLTADVLGARLWPKRAGRQSPRLLKHPGFRELVDLGLVVRKPSAGYYLPFAPPTGLCPVIPKPVAIPRREKTGR